jgi:hypothetical protein
LFCFPDLPCDYIRLGRSASWLQRRSHSRVLPSSSRRWFTISAWFAITTYAAAVSNLKRLYLVKISLSAAVIRSRYSAPLWRIEISFNPLNKSMLFQCATGDMLPAFSHELRMLSGTVFEGFLVDCLRPFSVPDVTRLPLLPHAWISFDC